MTSKFTMAALLAVIAVVTVAMMMHREDAGSSHPDPARAEPARSGSEAIVRVLPRKGPTTATSPMQRVSETPVVTYEQFKERRRCFEINSDATSLLAEIAELKAGITGVAEELRGDIVNAIRFKETQLGDLKKCSDNYRAITLDDLSKMLETAAVRGDQAAQLKYAQDPMIDPFHAIDNLERLRAWRDRALSYVNSAIDKGSGEAMVVLAGSYDPFRCAASNEPFCSGMLMEIVDPDAQKAFRYYYQSELIGNAPQWVKLELSALERLLTQDQIASAKLAAQASSSNAANRPF